METLTKSSKRENGRFPQWYRHDFHALHQGWKRASQQIVRKNGLEQEVTEPFITCRKINITNLG
jgi:hypothetical protein